MGPGPKVFIGSTSMFGFSDALHHCFYPLKKFIRIMCICEAALRSYSGRHLHMPAPIR
jgi:hypothetical protein